MATTPFTAEIIGWAQAAENVYQIPSSLNLSAAKVESNLGRSTPPNSNNWHGFQDFTHGVGSSALSHEEIDGVLVPKQEKFMVFASPADSFMHYGKLLGLGKPYHDMVTTFLQSPRMPVDVQNLSKALTGVYATASNYGSALILAQHQYGLYAYDKGVTQMVDTTADTTTPRVTPTIAQGVRIDWGSFFAQFIEHEKPIIEAVASGGLKLALSQIPMGNIVEMFIGPTLVAQYLDQGLTALEGLLKDQSVTVPASNLLETTIANLINANEPKLVEWLGANLDPMIKAAVAKLNL